MTKKYLVIGMAAILGASLSFFACESATDGAAGAAGEPGAPGVIYLSGSQTTAGIQAAIDSDAPLVFAGVTQSDTGAVTIPAGRNVTLVGTGAYTVANNAVALLILADAESVSGDGTIVTQAAGTVIAPQTVLNDKVTGAGKLAYQTIGDDGVVTFSGNTAAVVGNVTIATAGVTGTTIPAASLAGKTLYVVGDLTVSDAVTATALNVLGDVTASAAITGAVAAIGEVSFTGSTAQDALTGLNAGSVESAVAITTTGNGAVTVSGELKGTALTLGGTGTLTAGSLDLSGNLTAGTATTGAVTVNGAATIGGTVTNGAAVSVFTFNGTTAIDTFTSGNPGTVIAGTGEVAIAKTLVDTSTNTVSIKNTGGVTLTAANTIADNLVATKVTITTDGTNGLTIDSDGTALTVPTGGSVTVPASAASIVAGGETNNVTITGATLKPGVYTGASGKLSLSTTAEIAVANGGAIDIAGTGDLELTAATSKVTLNAGGAIDVKAATGAFGEATQTETLVTVAASSATDTPAKADITNTDTTWTVTATAGTGSAATNIILGKLKLALTGTAAINNASGADAESSAAAGKLIAGTGTVITFIGTN
jgi:hypothetical protein